MTTSGIGGMHSNYGTTTAKTERSKESTEAKGDRVEGQRPPPPPPKNQDTYVPSQEATTALAELATAEEDVATMEQVGTEATDKPTSYKLDEEAVAALKADFSQQQQNFYNSMMSMVTGQADASLNATGIWDKINLGEYTVTPEMQAEAQEAISEDGYWGVEQTATRIVDMAKALSGGDPAKADELMAAIEKGYEEAEKAWGGELPPITADTKARVDEMFAEWKESA